ncbi:hypothetical protein NHH03_11010 [Stieleria sp. TO1_6]|uniref:hypothetical protein n=1 Tax=Stieleria tagensis TaxID=2956795 RepID=UPI00209B831A|nr:hypothetical protein [Stieleria tagensis]MCO8122270.1 hypothetical protein [Stieleria tagensis]
MRYSYLIALATLMAMPTVSTFSQEPTADQRLRARPSSAIFSETGLIRFRLMSGRLEVDPMRYRKGTQEYSDGQFSETMTVASAAGIPSVHYTFRDDYQQIQLIAEHGKGLRIESRIHATGERAVLEQVEDGLVHWSTQRDPAVTSELDTHLSGPTLLHVIGQDQSGFQIHVEELSTRMLRGRSLIALTGRTETYLRTHVKRLAVVSADDVNQLIDQLKSPKIARRRAAVIKLCSLGSVALPHLSAALVHGDLDPEQTTRIKSILSRCPRMDEDTVTSLAYLLSTDRQHWQILSQRMDQSEWIAANAHIRKCGLDDLTR